MGASPPGEDQADASTRASSSDGRHDAGAVRRHGCGPGWWLRDLQGRSDWSVEAILHRPRPLLLSREDFLREVRAWADLPPLQHRNRSSQGLGGSLPSCRPVPRTQTHRTVVHVHGRLTAINAIPQESNMSASTLIVRIAPGYDDKGNPDNLVAYNRGLSTLQLLELLVKQAKQGMPQANAGGASTRTPLQPLGRSPSPPAAGPSPPSSTASASPSLPVGSGRHRRTRRWPPPSTPAPTHWCSTSSPPSTSALGVVTVTAVESAVGLSGNAITTTATGTGFSAGQARLTGGTDGTAQVAAATATCAFTASSASGDLTAVIGGFTFIRAHATSDAADAAALASLVCEPSIRLPYSGQTGNFTAKLTVTGATSGRDRSHRQGPGQRHFGLARRPGRHRHLRRG
jgi:hypothetical protein